MNGRQVIRLALAALGTAAVVGATVWSVTGGIRVPPFTARVVAALVALLAVAVALVRLRPRSATVEGPMIERAPERTTLDRPLAGRAFAGELDTAAGTARHNGLDAGVEALRPALRETLIAARTRAGVDRAQVEWDIERGTWTDDPVAAAVLAPDLDPPRRSLWRRLADWLRPERALRRRSRRATGAISAAAGAALPPVPGQRAPRTAPVSQPAVEDIRDASMMRVESAIDPRIADRRRGDESVEET